MAQTSNEMKEVVDGWISKQIGNVHTAIPGTVVSFDTGSNRAQVQPCGKYKLEDGRSLDYPIINNVPVVFPVGMAGDAGITFPVISGDGCLIVYAEAQMDDYLSGGDSDDTRGHDMNDAICVPGLYSAANSTSASNPLSVCLFCNGSTVLLNGSEFSGTLADGTTFSFSGGDLVVNGISLTKHVHGGVESGGSKTSKPE